MAPNLDLYVDSYIDVDLYVDAYVYLYPVVDLVVVAVVFLYDPLHLYRHNGPMRISICRGALACCLVAACGGGSGGVSGSGGSGGTSSAGTGGTSSTGTGGTNSAGTGGTQAAGGSGGATSGSGGTAATGTAATGGAAAAGTSGRGGASGASNIGGSGGASGTAGGTAGSAGSAGEVVVYVASASGPISLFSLDTTTGVLTSRGTTNGGTNPGYLAWDSARKFLYAGNGGQGRVTAFSIAPATGALSRLGDVSTAGMGHMGEVTHVSVHPTGKWVLADHFNSGHVAVLPIATDGMVGAPVDIQRPATEAHQVISDASGRHVFVPCRSGGIVAQYGFDSGTGRLTPASPPSVAAASGAGPRHMALHPMEKFAYVVNELNGTLTSYLYDATAGTLSMPESVSTVASGVNERSAAHVIVHPSGGFVYASNRTSNNVAIFRVDAQSGRVTRLGNENGGGTIRTPRDFGMDPSGRFLLVGNQGTSTVSVFRIDANTGLLASVGNPVSVASMPQFVGALLLP